MIDSRAKGKLAERSVEKIVQGAGIPCERPLDGRHQVAGDLVTQTYPQLAMEVRSRKRIEIVKWSHEHEDLVGEGEVIPAVVYRTDGDTTWRASLTLVDLLWLLELALVDQPMQRAA